MDLSNYSEVEEHRAKRILWYVINATIFRLLMGTKLRYIRNIILRGFGAKLPLRSVIYNSCKIWAPWNLEVGEYCCIGPNTELYNKAPITIKNHVVISQGAFLCTASHDIYDVNNAMIKAPIVIEDKVWIASKSYIGMGVVIGEGAVVGATSSVYKSVKPWSVVGGNPAKFIKDRVIN